MTDIRPIPESLSAKIREHLNDPGADPDWNTARLVEKAYHEGYSDGYTRGVVDEQYRVVREEKRRSASHEDTCPARHSVPQKCQCYNPPDGR